MFPLVRFSNLNNQIYENAVRCGLRVNVDHNTPSDGNCWYHAVVQQLRRPEILTLLNSEMKFMDSKTLREKVCSYIQGFQLSCPYIIEYRKHSQLTSPIHWKQYLHRHSKDGTFADQLFIQATAVLI